jgi:CelD/BcsL family acetyltransferase involved in cellulose biosynthesis
MLQCRTLTTAAEIRALEAPWRALALRGPAPSVFLTWEWVSAWCDEYASRCSLRCLTVWDEGGELRGVAPLALGGGPPLPAGCLGFISSTTRSWGVYMDFIVDPQASAEIVTALLGQLAEEQGKVRDIWLVRMDAESPLLALLPRVAAQLNLNLTVCPDRPCVRGPLPASVDEFVSAMPSKSQRKRLRRYERSMEENGLELRVRSFSREPDTEPLLQALAAHKEARADHFAVGNNFSDPAFTRCLRDFIGRLQAQDWFVGLTAEINGAPVAARIGAVYRGKLYSYLASFDGQYADYGVAHLLLLPFVGEGIERGATQLDFMSGDQAHKTAYLAGRGQTLTAILHDSRPRSAWPVLTALGAKAFRATAKRLLRRNAT